MKNSRTRTILGLAVVAVAAIVLTAASANADMVFSENFESPVVVGYDQYPPLPAGWVASNQGYGSNKSGLFNDGAGNQSYAFRYTNSGLTTAEGVIGDLTLGETYTISFDVAADLDLTQLAYTAQLVAFAPEAPRNDTRSTPAGSEVLSSSGGKANDDGTWRTVSFEFTPDAVDNAASIGKDLGIRFIGASSSALIDNVKVDVVPEPATMSLLVLGGLGLLRRRRRA